MKTFGPIPPDPRVPQDQPVPQDRITRRRRVAAAIAVTALLAAGCGVATSQATSDAVGLTNQTDTDTATPTSANSATPPVGSAPGDTESGDLAFADESIEAADGPGQGTAQAPAPNSVRNPEGVLTRPPATLPEPVSLGSPGAPFAELPQPDEATAVLTSTGIVMPVISEREDSWLVSTVCQNIGFVHDATPIGRAHVVIDPGHGGKEVGAVSPDGALLESELNLQVATRAAEILTAAGATVVLTRTGDYQVTAAARGHIAAAIQPGLFVSVHHNGGAPANGDRPGTLVFTKTGSDEASRFGGIFYETLQPVLTAAAEPKQEAYRVYAEALDAYEAQILAHDQSAEARDAVLVANGQLPPEVAITVPPPTTIPADGLRLPSVRELPTTTTLPVAVPEPVPVPDTLPLPEPFTAEPVREFLWAGTGNAGVRAWTRADGKDFLALLRHSGEVPAALSEFLFITNPVEAELLADPAFIEAEARVLAEAITVYFSTDAQGTGFVADQFDDQPIGGSGGVNGCVDPEFN